MAPINDSTPQGNIAGQAAEDQPQVSPASSANYGSNLAEDLITVLCWNDTHGKLIAELVDPALFPGEYGMIAQRAVDYHKQYNEAPKGHTANLLAPELEAGGRRAEHLQRTLYNMMRTNWDGINNAYVMDNVSRFIRTQKLKDGVIRSAQMLCNGGKVEDAEKILDEVLRGRSDSKFDPGIDLGDLDSFFELFEQRVENEFITGIRELDLHHATPARDTVSVLIAVLGHGKSWWLVHLGRRALMRRKNVLHVSLELPKDQVLARYWQSICAVPQSEAYLELKCTMLRFPDANPLEEPPLYPRLIGFKKQEVKARFALRQADAKEKVREFIRYRPGLFTNRLRVKHFPMNTLTVPALDACLDQLQASGFVPDLLLLDHANVMRIERDQYRLAFGETVQDLEKLAQQRHIAVATAAQSNREGHKAKRVSIGNTGEDWSLPQTVDTVLTLSRNEDEQRHGLGRLWVGKNRLGGQQEFGVVITQNYAHGQFALESAWLHADYDTLLDALPE